MLVCLSTLYPRVCLFLPVPPSHVCECVIRQLKLVKEKQCQPEQDQMSFPCNCKFWTWEKWCQFKKNNYYWLLSMVTISVNDIWSWSMMILDGYVYTMIDIQCFDEFFPRVNFLITRVTKWSNWISLSKYNYVYLMELRVQHTILFHDIFF